MENFEANHNSEQNELRYHPEGLKQDIYYVVQGMDGKETPFSIATVLIENMKPEHRSLVRHQMSELESFPIIRPGDIMKINDNIQVLINEEAVTAGIKEQKSSELQPIGPDGKPMNFTRKIKKEPTKPTIDRRTRNLYDETKDYSRGKNLYDPSKDNSR